MLSSLLLHALLLAAAVVIARNAVAEPSAESDPVRLTFVEAPRAPAPVVLPEGGGGGGGGEVTVPPEVVPLPPPEERTRRRRVAMAMPDLTSPEQEEEGSEELALVVPNGDVEDSVESVDAGVRAPEGTGAGEASGTGPGTGGGTGGGSGTGTGAGTGGGTGLGHSAPVYYRAGMERPRLVSGDHPRYTRQAREAGVEGTVVARILIGRDGRVRDVRIIGSTVPLLDDEVLRTVAAWRFSPPMVEGRRVEMILIQRIRFDREQR